MESSYTTSHEIQSSIAVGTVKRGLSSSKLIPRLGIVQLPRSGVDHVPYLFHWHCVKFMPVSGASEACFVLLPLPQCVCAVPLLPLRSPAACSLELPPW